MHAPNLIRRLHQHLRWSRDRLLETCAALSSDELEQRFDIGMGSLWETIVHLYAAEFAWINAIDGDPVGTLLTGEDVPGWATLSTAWAVCDARWDALLGGITEDDLDQIIIKARVLPGQAADQTYPTSLADVLMHVCTHAAYTMAQASNMLRHLGVRELPPLMLITMAREEALPAALGDDG